MTKTKPKKLRKDSNVYPAGWDYKRVKAIADYYDARKNEDVFGEAEVARSSAGVVWMEVPEELVPKVRKLLATHKKPA